MFALTPAQCLPKPATSQFPEKRRALRATWSPEEREKRFPSRANSSRFFHGWPRQTHYFLGKYLSIVSLLGGGVSREKMIMHSAEPKTMGTTVM